MKNKNTYAIVLILALIIIAWVFSNGAFKQPPNLEFSFKDCDNSVSPYNTSQLGVREKIWLDDTTLSVKAYVSINCAEKIKYGNYAIDNNTLNLEYRVPSNPSTNCMCAHEINYKINDLENKEYNISLKRI